MRTRKCVDSKGELLATFDEEEGVKNTSDYHSKVSEVKDLELVLNELGTHVNPFMHIPNKHYKKVKVPKNTLLQSLNQERLSFWLKQKCCALLASLF